MTTTIKTATNNFKVDTAMNTAEEKEFKFEIGKTYYADTWNGEWSENVPVIVKTLKVIKRTAKTLTAIDENGEQVTKRITLSYHGTTERVGLESPEDITVYSVNMFAKHEFTDKIAAAPTDRYNAWLAAVTAAENNTVEADTTVETETEYKPQTEWENPHDFTTVGNLNGQPRKYVDPEAIAAPKGFWANRINGTYTDTINGEFVIFENHSIVYIDAEKKLGYFYKKSDAGRKIFYRGNQRFAASKIVEAYMNGQKAAEQNKAHHEFFNANKTAYNNFFQVLFRVTTADGRIHNFERTFDSFDAAKALVDKFTATFDEPTDIIIKQNKQNGEIYYKRTDGNPGNYTDAYFGNGGFDPEVFSLLPALDDLNDVEDEPMGDAKINSEHDTGEEIEMPLVVLKDKLTDLTEQSSQLFNYIHCSDDRQKADAAFKGEMQLICSGRAQSPERRQIEAENEARRARLVVAEAHYSCLQNDCAKLVAAIASNGRITKRILEVIMDKKPHVLNNTGTCEWYTPPAVIDAVLDVLDEIDLDPASSRIANEIVGAKKFFTRDDDGLKQDWFGNVFLNPPCSKGLIDKFIDKLRAEIIVGHIKEAVVLVNAATDTRWYERAIEPAKGICFTRGKIKFIKPDGSFANQPTCGQVFLYYGRRCDKFFDVFQSFGVCMKTTRRRRIFYPEFLTNRFHDTPITKPTKKYSRQR